MKKKRKSFFKEHWLILLILALLLAWLIYSYSSQGVIFSLINNDVSETLSFFESFGIFAALIFIVLIILECVLAPIPPLILYIVAGVLFGGFLGGVLTLIGNLIGAFIDFKIARKYGQKNVQKSINKKFRDKFNRFFEKYGALSIFILRVNPITTSDLVSYLSGFTKIKTTKFLVATGLGLIPMIFIQTYLGEELIRKSSVLFAITLIFSFLYLVVFIYLIIKALSKEKKN